VSSPALGHELPPRLELECLKVLWTLGEASVRGIQAEVSKSRPLAYTTVMTVMERLTKRGCVQRRKSGRSFVYTAVLSRDAVRRIAVEELVDNVFDGCESSLRAYLHHSPPFSGD
jgi:BlaI family penicillinase repressor